MSEHLPDVQLTDEQAARAEAIWRQLTTMAAQNQAARLIVSLQDEIERLRRENAELLKRNVILSTTAAVDERLDRVERELAEGADLTFVEEASGLIDLLESDFGQSGADVRYEAIRCELVAAFNRGKRAAQPPRDGQ